jgi:hypothetical protein
MEYKNKTLEAEEPLAETPKNTREALERRIRELEEASVQE